MSNNKVAEYRVNGIVLIAFLIPTRNRQVMKQLKVMFIITWTYFKCLRANLTKEKTFIPKPTNDYWEK